MNTPEEAEQLLKEMSPKYKKAQATDDSHQLRRLGRRLAKAFNLPLPKWWRKAVVPEGFSDDFFIQRFTQLLAGKRELTPEEIDMLRYLAINLFPPEASQAPPF